MLLSHLLSRRAHFTRRLQWLLRFAWRNANEGIRHPVKSVRFILRTLLEAVGDDGRLSHEVVTTVEDFNRRWSDEDAIRRIAFDDVAKPVVSIIIPVYKNLAWTVQCLASLQENVASGTRFEVIVVDDASPDNSPDRLAMIEGLRLIRGEENRGFVHSCNAGAAIARGEYLFFLNNDTIVMPHCLEELLATFDETPAAGLVGARLLYPNGSLQEAGGIIWRDGSAWNYGNGCNPSEPQYSYLRDADYCSGAAIMISKNLFELCGGFDPAYAPGYCEDSDLAFQVRSRGLRVLYQPFARVIHFEGQTSGRDVTKGMKRFQIPNQRKLFERWKGTIASWSLPHEKDCFHRDRHHKRHVLMIDAVTPQPDHDAGSYECVFHMRCFQEMGFHVSFAPQNLAFIENYTHSLQRSGIECLYSPFVCAIHRYLQQEGHRLDVVWVYRYPVLQDLINAIREYAPQAKLIFDTSDVHFLRLAREAELTKRASDQRRANQAKQIELGLMRRSDVTVVCSEYEAELLHREAPEVNVRHLPVCRDMRGKAASYAERNNEIVFIGGYQHGPNVDAVRWFVESIWPLVRARLPDARFVAVGSKAEEYLGDVSGERVEIRGFVEELSDVFDSCRLSVAPLRFGAGVKGKVFCSLGYGVPCVATPVAVEGARFENGVHCLVASDPEAFADAVVRVYRDPTLWTNLAARGIELMNSAYSRPVIVDAFRRLISDTLGDHSPMQVSTSARKATDHPCKAK